MHRFLNLSSLKIIALFEYRKGINGTKGTTRIESCSVVVFCLVVYALSLVVYALSLVASGSLCFSYREMHVLQNIANFVPLSLGSRHL